MCGEIRAQDNREGLHERPNAESSAVGIIRGLTVEMEREERKNREWMVWHLLLGIMVCCKEGDRQSDG